MLKKSLFLVLMLTAGFSVAIGCPVPTPTPAPTPTPTPTPTPPPNPAEVLMPVYGYVTQTTGNLSCAGVDAGAGDKYLYRFAESCQEGDVGGTIAVNCPGFSDPNLGKCTYSFYTDIGKNGCNTQTAPLWTYANGTREAAFLHVYNGITINGITGDGTITSTNRNTVAQTSTCSGVGGSNSTTYLMNFGDTTFETYLAAHFWNVAPWNTANTNVFLDDSPMGYTQFSQAASAEYGNLHTYEAGNGANASLINWQQAVAAEVNTAGALGIHVNLNGVIGGYANPCSPNGTITGTNPWHCTGQIAPNSAFSSGEYDNQTDLRSFCAALNSNALLDSLVSEDTFDRSGTYQPSYLVSGFIATEVTLVNDHNGAHADNCAGARMVDLEDIGATGTSYVRGFQDALQGMVAGTDGTPFDIQWRSPNEGGRSGGTSGWLEPNFWLDEAVIVPYLPYITPTDYVFNGSSGTVKENGTGCPNNGDSGGAVALLLACNSTDGFYGNCWHSAWDNGTNLGPTCFFLNATGVSETITTAEINSICSCAASFVGGSVVTYSGGEALTVPDQYAPGGTVSTGCTGAGLTHCDGAIAVYGTNFTAGTTAVAGPGGLEIMAASPTPSPSPTPTPTPGPTPTPTPTPSPTPTPTPTPPPGGYQYLGVHVYPANDAVITYDAAAVGADTNSTTIINHVAAVMDWTYGDTESLERVNTATSATATYTVQTNGGHNPPITAGLAGGGLGAVFHWIPGTFVAEGSCTLNCSGDGHVVTILTDTCLFEEGGAMNWNGTQLKAYDGFIDTCNDTYYAQHGNKGDNVTVAGIGMLGWTDYGEEASGITIAHPVGIGIPVAASAPTATTNYAGSGGNDNGTCNVGPTLCTEMGDIWVYIGTCPSSPTSAVLLCQQLSYYGGVVNDTTGSSSGKKAFTRMGLSANGTGSHWSGAATWLATIPVDTAHWRIAKRQSLSFFCC